MTSDQLELEHHDGYTLMASPYVSCNASSS